MSHLILPRREIWTRQPQGAVEIDWGNPLARGLDGFALPTGKFTTIVNPVSPYLAVSKSGVGLAWSQNTNNARYFSSTLSGVSSSKRTLFYVGSAFSSGDNNGPMASLHDTNILRILADGVGVKFGVSGSWGTTLSARVDISGEFSAAITSTVGGSASYYLNGESKGSVTGFGWNLTPAFNFGFGGNGFTGNWSSSAGGLLVLVFSRHLSGAEIKSLSANPWQIFKPRQSRLFVSLAPGGGSTLNAVATGLSSASGTAGLAAQVALAAVGVALADGAAAPAVQIPLSAAGMIVAAGAANAQATVTISAAGLAQAGGQAGLSASLLLQAAGAARAAGNATLAAQLNVLASGAAQASGSANLSGGAPGVLTADGAAQAAGSAGLSVTVGLSASGINTAGGGANLSAPAPGALSASGAASAQGGLNPAATVSLTAAGFVQAMAAGVLTLTLPLSAFAPLTMAVSHQRLSRLTTVSQRLSTLLCGVSHG